jgi:DNA processing protein
MGARDVLAAIAKGGLPIPRRPLEGARGARARKAPAPHARHERRGDEPLDDGERAVVAAIGDGPTHLDEVCERTRLTPKVIAAIVLTLTLRAVVVEGPAGFFRRASPVR